MGDVGGTLLNMPGTLVTALDGALDFGSGLMAAPFDSDVAGEFFQDSQDKSFAGQVLEHGGSHEDASLAAAAIGSAAVVGSGTAIATLPITITSASGGVFVTETVALGEATVAGGYILATGAATAATYIATKTTGLTLTAGAAVSTPQGQQMLSQGSDFVQGLAPGPPPATPAGYAGGFTAEAVSNIISSVNGDGSILMDPVGKFLKP